LRPLKNLEVQEKQTATFECEINKPKQTAHWFQAGTEITPEMNRFKPENEGNVFRLVIENCHLEDTQKYKCVFDKDKTQAKLTVTGRLKFYILNTFHISTGM
jgi:hypothetical protein